MSLFRFASFAVFLLGLAASFSWAWWQLSLFERDNPAPWCGMPILGIYAAAILGVGVTSFLSALLNAISFMRLSKPRSRLRILELAVLATPAVLTMLLFGVLLYVG